MTSIRFVTGKPSGILSDISSGILSGICSGISSGILPGISSAICSGISSGILSGCWGRLRSSGAHWARKVPGWGPAVPSALRPLQLRSSSAHCVRKLAKSLAKSWQGGSEHGSGCKGGGGEAGGGGRGGGGGGEGGGGGGRTALIKSNNPHLAGGEKQDGSGSIRLLRHLLCSLFWNGEAFSLKCWQKTSSQQCGLARSCVVFCTLCVDRLGSLLRVA